MKLYTLVENTAGVPGLQAEHGLSLYLETGPHRILFDMGQSRAFLENGEKMGVDLSRVQTAVLSHGHYDHGGGLGAFLEVNAQAPVYVRPEAFGSFWHGPEKYIGLDPGLKDSPRLVYSGDETEIAPGITLFSCNALPRPYRAAGSELSVLQNGAQVPDRFLHEQYLLIEEAGRRILLSGCSHKGIFNILSWFRPDVLIGGFHFKNISPQGEGEAILRRAARELLTYPTRYYTGHCTGSAQYALLRREMGDRITALYTGFTGEI